MPKEQVESPRLLWIHQNFVSPREAGNSRAALLVSDLVERGYKVDIVRKQVSYWGVARVSNPSEGAVETEGNLSIHYLPARKERDNPRNRGASYIDFILRAFPYVRRLQRPSVVFASSPPLPQLALSLYFSWRYSRPLVLEVRDIWPAFIIETQQLQSKVLRASMYFLENLAYQYADTIISVSPGFESYLKGMGVGTSTVAVTGADDRWIETDKSIGSDWRVAKDIQDKIVILYTGSFNKSHGISKLLKIVRESAKISEKIHWVLAGEGQSADEVRKVAGELSNLDYLGALPKKDLAPVMWAADLAIVSLAPIKLFEMVIPGKLFDYLAAGLPVVSFVDGISGAIIRESTGGWIIEPEDAKLVTARLLKVAELDRAELAKIGMNGQKWILKNMHSRPSASLITSKIDELLSTHSNAPFLYTRKLCKAVFSALSRTLKRQSQKQIEQFKLEFSEFEAEKGLKTFLDHRSEPLT